MKLKNGWTLTALGDEYVAVPTQESTEDLRGIIRLNETGRDIWQGLMDGLSEQEIADKLVQLYDEVDQDRAQRSVRRVIDQLQKEGVLEP